MQHRKLMIKFWCPSPHFQGERSEKWSNFEQKNGFTAVSQELFDGFRSCLIFSIIMEVSIAERKLVTLT